MSPTNLSRDDRDAIQALLLRYVWAMDTGDIDGIAACFTPDGRVKDITGRLWQAPDAARRFAAFFIDRPDRPAMQHWMQGMLVEDAPGGGYTLTSYWLTGQRAADGSLSLSALGCYVDTVVRLGGAWLIQEKRIDPWDQGLVAQIAASR